MCLLLTTASLLSAADDEDDGLKELGNRTELVEPTDEAEFRQGGISQQLMSGYPVAYASNQYASGGGYANMLRNLYRPPSLGLTDKVKHWVKSFMNRRQYTKPYYSPSPLQYSSDEFAAGKPVFLAGNSYKAISVPLRQLQKYYKPYHGGETGGVLQQPQTSGSAAFLNYSPYASSNSGAGQFFAGGDAAGLFSQGETGAGFGASNGLYSASSGGSSAGSVYGLSNGSPGSSSLYSISNGSPGSNGLYGTSSGNSGSSSSLYQAPSGSSSVFSLDASSLYGSADTNSGSSPYFGASSSGSILSSGSDLYASGASPVASVYNPNQQSGYTGKKQPESALFMSSDQRNAESYAVKDPAPNSFSLDSGRKESAPHSSFSVAFHPSSSQGGSGFQPVSFASDFQGKNS